MELESFKLSSQFISHHVLDRSAKAICSLFVQLLRQSEINDDNMTGCVKHDILQFDVAINNVQLK